MFTHATASQHSTNTMHIVSMMTVMASYTGALALTPSTLNSRPYTTTKARLAKGSLIRGHNTISGMSVLTTGSPTTDGYLRNSDTATGTAMASTEL